MENEKVGLRLYLRISENVKNNFKKDFKESTYKNHNDFLNSLLKTRSTIRDENEIVSKIKRFRLDVRVTEEEKKVINDTFNSSNEKRLGVFLVKCVTVVPIKIEKVNRLADEISVEIRRIGNNLNQIALRANQSGTVGFETNQLLKEIEAQLTELTKVK